MMSNCSSETNVVKTRIQNYEEDDDDNTVLYAYEPNTAYYNTQENALSEASFNGEENKTITNVLNQCQVIYGAIQNLDKKFDVIDGKVSKIQRLRAKSFWNYRKPIGFPCKNHNHQVSKKIKLHKAKKKEREQEPEQDQDQELEHVSSFSYPESYSPTLPVRRPENDDSSIVIPSFQSEEFQELEQDSLARDQEPCIRDTPPRPICPGHPYQMYIRPEDAANNHSVVPLFASSGAANLCSISPRALLPPSGAVLVVEDTRHDIKGYPDLMGNKYTLPPHQIQAGFVNSSLPPVTDDLKGVYPGDPFLWSVDDVILFLKHADPQMSSLISVLIQEHEIDGRALLLLNSDTMIKYMGLKLGTVLKLCHYIDSLKEAKGLNN